MNRVNIGEVHLGDLPEGKWRVLTENEVASLREIENTITQKETAPSHPVAVEDVDQDAKKDAPQGQNKYRDPPQLS